MPEAFVLDAAGRLVYRGAIDNAWEDIGRRRPRAEKTFLADAVRAVVDGKPIPVAQTKAVGCLFESPAGSPRYGAFRTGTNYETGDRLGRAMAELLKK